MEEDEKKKMNKGVIAGICIALVAAIAAVVAVVIINVAKPNVVGRYKMTAILDENGNESSDAMKLFDMLGASYEIEFKDDKTGVFEVKMDSEKMSSVVSSFANALSEAFSDGTSESSETTTTETTTVEATEVAETAESIDLTELTETTDPTEASSGLTTTSSDALTTTGSSSLATGNSTTQFTYDDKKVKMGSGSFGGVEMDYEFKDGAVILSISGQKMKFTKE